MCGIFGVLAFDCRCSGSAFVELMLGGLRRLEYRGYDSSGMYIVLSGQDYLFKSVGNVSRLAMRIQQGNDEKDEKNGLGECVHTHTLGIAHTRWSTHGSPSEMNTHPHRSKDFVVVHNGIITNYAPLRTFLTREGYVFKTETDTEVIPMLCQYIRDTSNDTSSSNGFVEIVRRVIERLEGSFAIVVSSPCFPHELVGAKRGSPLVLGLDERQECKRFVLASDPTAIVEHTNRVLTLEDGDLLHIHDGTFSIYNQDIELGVGVDRQMEIMDTHISAISKGHFAHFMLKEIHEQVMTIQRTMDGRLGTDDDVRLGGMSDFLDDIRHANRLVFIACGSSFYACLAVRPLFECLLDIPIVVENSCDFTDRDASFFSHDVCIFVSQSGETADVMVVLERARQQRRRLCVGITNVVGSTIDRQTTCGIHLNAGTEIGVASTKSFTSQIVAMSMLAIALSKDSVSRSIQRRAIVVSLREMPRHVQSILEMQSTFDMLAEKMMHETSIIFIGRRQNYATALEASLKMKEVAYIHCEGMIAGELKHGGLALIDDHVLVVVIATADDRMRVNVDQLRSRKARMIILTDDVEMYSDCKETTTIIELPKTNSFLRPIVDIIPFQLLAYFIAVRKGYNVDQPRNLAKSVTVTD